MLGSWCLAPHVLQSSSRDVLECHSAAIMANQWGEKQRPRLVHVMLDLGYTGARESLFKNCIIERFSGILHLVPCLLEQLAQLFLGSIPFLGMCPWDCWVPWLSSAALGRSPSPGTTLAAPAGPAAAQPPLTRVTPPLHTKCGCPDGWAQVTMPLLSQEPLPGEK